MQTVHRKYRYYTIHKTNDIYVHSYPKHKYTASAKDATNIAFM